MHKQTLVIVTVLHSKHYSTTASSAQQHIQLQQQQIANSTGPALYMTTTGPNGSPLILSIPTQNNIVNFDPGMYHQMSTTKPEAKKVKIQKSQPSKVVHIRNIPPQISEVEVIQFGLIFGNIANVLNLRSKCQVCVFCVCVFFFHYINHKKFSGIFRI